MKRIIDLLLFVFVFFLVSSPFKVFCAPATITASVDVNANYNSIFDSPSDTSNPPSYHPWLADTGMDLNIGDTLEINSTGFWRISGSDPWTNANGQIGRYSSGYYISSLLGQISQTGWQTISHGHPSTIPFFFIGTNYNETITEAGRLYLGFNDTDYGNNEGIITANIRATSQHVAPEPSSFFLFGIGLLGMFKRRFRA